MDAGGLAQMSGNFMQPMQPHGLGMAGSGLASRRGGQNIKPLSVDALKSPTGPNDTGVPTPRTSRSHLLAGLRTAPKSATAATFPASPTSAAPQMTGRNNIGSAMYANAQETLYSGPKTSLPRYGTSQHHGYNSMMGNGQQYTADQILAPPEIQVDEHGQEQMDPNLYNQLVTTNIYLAHQQRALQQQLRDLQSASQRFQGLSLNGMQQQQQQYGYQNIYQQQQPQYNVQQVTMGNQPVYAVYNPMTGQQELFVEQNNNQQFDQSQYAFSAQQQHLQQQQAQQQQHQQQQQQQQQQQAQQTPRVQVSPPPTEVSQNSFRNNSPPRRYESPSEVVPLPPPSANAFRRGHKKSSSLANNPQLSLSSSQESPKSAGPKTASFPLTPMTGYGPGQGRAGEHPIRQPRGPPSFDELASKPTAKHEGSKNFAARTRRSAVGNLVRAGMERRKGTGSSGGCSPISEIAEEVETPITDNDSDSGRSGSGSLEGDAECSLPSSRTSTGSWGAIGSDRPNSRQKGRQSVDSTGSDSDSFANVFKKGSQRTPKPVESDGQRKAPMLVLTSAEKRKSSVGPN